MLNSNLKEIFLGYSPRGLVWPRAMNPLAASAYQLLEYLEQSQWFTSKEILDLQAQQIQALIKHAQMTVPFYERRLAEVAKLSSPEDLLKSWHTIPLLTRDDLQKNGEMIFSHSQLSDHGEATPLSTSGSTGKPVTILTNYLLQFYWKVFSLRDHVWHQRDFSKKMAVIRDITDPKANYPHGIHTDSWGPVTYGMIPTGSCYALGLCHPRDQLAWLNRVNPHYLLCYPTVLRSILEQIELGKEIQFTNLIQARTFGEIVDTSLREKVKYLLGVPLVDIYSSTEVGNIALQCPVSNLYHIQAENVFVEILTDNNKPCLPGEIGKIVITHLHNFASPLIRYEIGDFAEISSTACECGRGLLSLSKILGRRRNMLVLPNGERRWPSFTGSDEDNLLKVFGKQQFQVIQHSLDEIEIKIAGEPGIINEMDSREILQKLWGDEFHYRFSYVNNIPRVGGKYEDFKSLL